MNLSQAQMWAKTRVGAASIYIDRVTLSQNDVEAFEVLLAELAAVSAAIGDYWHIPDKPSEGVLLMHAEIERLLKREDEYEEELGHRDNGEGE